MHLDTLVFLFVNPVTVFILEELFQKTALGLVSAHVKRMLLRVDFNAPHVKLDSIYPATMIIMTMFMKAVL